MRVRRIALLISIFTLVAFATPAASAATEAPTLPQLRSQLRETRHYLVRALRSLSGARVSLTEVRAIVAADGGTPVLLPSPLLDGLDAPAADTTTGSTDGMTVDGTGALTTDATATDAIVAATDDGTTPAAAQTLPTVEDPVLASLIAALDPALAARLFTDGAISADEVTALQARVDTWRTIVRRVRRNAARLEARIALREQIVEWNREGAWRPLIEIAANRYHVDPDGLYRLMMAESGGHRYAGSTFKGLFQYHPGTWVADWNPWRSASIYNGWAQIQATAYAVSRGMGPSNWASTYYRAF